MTYVTPGAWSTGETVAVGKLNVIVNDMPALYDRLIHEVAANYSANDWNVSNAAGAWEADSAGCTVSLTLEQTSTVIVIIACKWYVTAAADEAMKFRVENVTSGTYSDSCGLYGSANADNRETAVVVGMFTGQAAGTKVYRLNGSRVTSGYTVHVTARLIKAIAISTA